MKKTKYEKINNILINTLLVLAVFVALDSLLNLIPNPKISLFISLGIILLLLILRIVNLRKVKRAIVGQFR